MPAPQNGVRFLLDQAFASGVVKVKNETATKFPIVTASGLSIIIQPFLTLDLAQETTIPDLEGSQSLFDAVDAGFLFVVPPPSGQPVPAGAPAIPTLTTLNAQVQALLTTTVSLDPASSGILIGPKGGALGTSPVPLSASGVVLKGAPQLQTVAKVTADGTSTITGSLPNLVFVASWGAANRTVILPDPTTLSIPVGFIQTFRVAVDGSIGTNALTVASAGTATIDGQPFQSGTSLLSIRDQEASQTLWTDGVNYFSALNNQTTIYGIANTQVVGHRVRNPSPATGDPVANQSYSPMTVWEGQGWSDTASASMPVEFGVQTTPVSGTFPAGALTFWSRINRAGGWAGIASLSTTGLWFTAGIQTAAVTLLSGGTLSLPSNGAINGPAIAVVPTTFAAGQQVGFQVIAPASIGSTGLNAATRVPTSQFSQGSTTKNWATGTGLSLTAQIDVFVGGGTTYTANAASTFGLGASFGVVGAPIAGTNLTLTNSAAMYAETIGGENAGTAMELLLNFNHSAASHTLLGLFRQGVLKGSIQFDASDNTNFVAAKRIVLNSQGTDNIVYQNGNASAEYTSASAGTHGAVPGQVAGYLGIMTAGGTLWKVAAFLA